VNHPLVQWADRIDWTGTGLNALLEPQPQFNAEGRPGEPSRFMDLSEERISKRRFRIEQCFGTMNRLFGLHRARYFAVVKTHAMPSERSRQSGRLRSRPRA